MVHFEELRVERLLSQIPLGDGVSAYVDAIIGAVASDPTLLRTLEVVCAASGRKAAAAALSLDRPSLNYRLAKIARLLDVDLTSPERPLELWQATRLRRVVRSGREKA